MALALEYGLMPGNLHYHRDTPNPESEGLRDGTLEVWPWCCLHLPSQLLRLSRSSM